MLERDELPTEDKSVDRLRQEGQLLLAAGTATTATTLSSAFVYLLLDHERLEILKKELEEAVPDSSKTPSQSQLEKLP